MLFCCSVLATARNATVIPLSRCWRYPHPLKSQPQTALPVACTRSIVHNPSVSDLIQCPELFCDGRIVDPLSVAFRRIALGVCDGFSAAMTQSARVAVFTRFPIWITFTF